MTTMEKLYAYADLVGRIHGITETLEPEAAAEKIKSLIEEFNARMHER